MRRVKWKQLGVTALVYVGAVLLLAGIGAGVFFGAKSYIDGVDSKAYKRGQTEAVAAYQARDNKALSDLNKRLLELQAKLRATEAKAADDVAAIDKEHQDALEKAKRIHDSDVAAARSGAIRLRDRWRNEARACASELSRSAGSSTTTATVSVDAAGGAELSPEAAGFLLGEADRADALVDKVTHLQSLVNTYLEIVNGRN